MALTAIAGQVFSYIALAFGIFFFLYATKYYVATLLALFGGGRLNVNDVNHLRNGGVNRGREPFISIHLPFYNERNVARRIIEACLNLDYTNYEIIVVDDSTDETVEILKEIGVKRRKPLPAIKVIHRRDRSGFKGGALAVALQHMDPRTEYVVVFDADFIPPRDILKRFLWYFGEGGEEAPWRNNHRFADRILGYFTNNHRNGGSSIIERVEEWYRRRRIAAVQGYQLHHLNKRENWITRGVRTEFSGSYMVERVAEEFFGAMKMIAGSVYMIRADVLRELGWTTSLTEDWELTVRLYLAGYKVVYTPLIQAPAEIPTTIMRLVRQRMRWAEGHTYIVKKYFWRVLRSPTLTWREKLEFLYFSPYYLQSFFFLIGTISWMIAEMLHQHPWFWTATFGWCLILSNLFALPLMGLTGLFMERSALEDFPGLLSFITLSYVIAPFQAYAALRGLLEKEEGVWFRTFKTGRITDRILSVRLRRLFGWILPRRSSGGEGRAEREERRGPPISSIIFLVLLSSLIAWITISVRAQSGGEAQHTALVVIRSEPTSVNGVDSILLLTRLGEAAPMRGEAEFRYSGDGWERAWRLLLERPLEEDFKLEGRSLIHLELSADANRQANIEVRILEVDEEGRVKPIASARRVDVELSTHPLRVSLATDPVSARRIERGHTLLVEIWLRGESGVYHLHYGSEGTRVEFPGIIVPEKSLPLLPIAPLIPVAVLKMRREVSRG